MGCRLWGCTEPDTAVAAGSWNSWARRRNWEEKETDLAWAQLGSKEEVKEGEKSKNVKKGCVEENDWPFEVNQRN